jgi:methionine sulfoxide reductase heme-binding subunit
MLRSWLLAGLAAGTVGMALGMSAAVRLGLASVAFERPDTHWFWYVSRAAGVSAYLALALSVVAGLLLSTGVADTWIARGRSVEIHRWLSAIALSLIAGHALVLLGDPYVHFDVLALLVPFASEYRPVAVGLGLLGAYAAVVVYASFWLRRLLGQRTWRRLHFLAFPTLGLVTLHGLLAGTDSAAPWMRLMYVVVSALVVWLSFYRAIGSLSGRTTSREASAVA